MESRTGGVTQWKGIAAWTICENWPETLSFEQLLPFYFIAVCMPITMAACLIFKKQLPVIPIYSTEDIYRYFDFIGMAFPTVTTLL